MIAQYKSKIRFPPCWKKVRCGETLGLGAKPWKKLFLTRPSGLAETLGISFLHFNVVGKMFVSSGYCLQRFIMFAEMMFEALHNVCLKGRNAYPLSMCDEDNQS